jgi:hypothetical protein
MDNYLDIYRQPAVGTALIISSVKAPREGLANPLGLDIMVSACSYPKNSRQLDASTTSRNASVENAYSTGHIEPITYWTKMGMLTHFEKQKLERELCMGGGSVLNFSNRTFEEFFREVVGIQIFDPRYALGSGSKANRLRAFWQVATDEQLRVFLGGLMEAWEIHSNGTITESARALFMKILVRLGGGVPQTAHESNYTKDSRITISEEISRKLHTQLLEVTFFPPQKRGYELERFLKDLFDAYGMMPRASFRNTGEQIDGSFILHTETYLLEAKWQNAPTAAADLHTFEGKLGEKASWSRGLFVSCSGFTTDGLVAFGRGKRLICMDGLDLSEMLRLRLSIIDVLDAKTRRAAETGNPYIPVRNLF